MKTRLKAAAVFFLSWAGVIGAIWLSDFMFRNHPGAVVAVWAVAIISVIVAYANKIVAELKAEIQSKVMTVRIVDDIERRAESAARSAGIPVVFERQVPFDVPAFLRKGGAI